MAPTPDNPKDKQVQEEAATKIQAGFRGMETRDQIKQYSTYRFRSCNERN